MDDKEYIPQKNIDLEFDAHIDRVMGLLADVGFVTIFNEDDSLPPRMSLQNREWGSDAITFEVLENNIRKNVTGNQVEFRGTTLVFLKNNTPQKNKFKIKEVQSIRVPNNKHNAERKRSFFKKRIW
jgi:hypothetical protein